MKKLIKISAMGLLLAGSLVATSANALTVDFAGDQATWGTGASSITSGSVTVSSNGPAITWENDGLGVLGGNEDDEIDDGETILVSFAAPVTITSIWLDDIWLNTGGDVGNVLINGVTPLVISPQHAFHSTPFPTIENVNLTNVSTLLFQSLVSGGGSNNAGDYALSRIDYDAAPAAVPVPAAFWLLGSSMVFLFRKRQTS